MLRRAPSLGLLFALAATAACTGGDGTPPTLMVVTPDRGSVSDTGLVTVSGTVVDDGAVKVTVNGTQANVAKDGTFTATVSVDPGVEALETIATDEGGLTDRDVRAVMSGNLAPSDGHVRDAVGAKIGPAAFGVIGQLVDKTVNALDLGAIARPLNPVYSTGGSCFGVDVNVTNAWIDNFSINLAPRTGTINIDATVSGLEIDLNAPYNLACFSGDDDVIITANQVHLTGGLGLSVSGGKLHASVEGLQIAISGLYLDVGGLPNSIVNLFSDQIAGIIADTLTTMVNDKVPPMIEQTLTDMSGKSWTLNVLSRDIAMGVAPTAINIDSAGAFVALDTNMRVAGGEGGVYVTTPMPLTTTLMTSTGLGVAVSDDALNQLFAGMWASGALDQQIAVDRNSPISLVVGGDTKVLKISMALPPTVAMDPSGDLRLTVGDLMLHAEDASGGDVMTVALTLSSTLGADATPDNHIALRLGEPTVYAQVVSQMDRPTPMTDADIEGLVNTVFPMVSNMANDAMATMPLPSVLGVSLDAPTLESRDGYVVMQTGVSFGGN